MTRHLSLAAEIRVFLSPAARQAAMRFFLEKGFHRSSAKEIGQKAKGHQPGDHRHGGREKRLFEAEFKKGEWVKIINFFWPLNHAIAAYYAARLE